MNLHAVGFAGGVVGPDPVAFGVATPLSLICTHFGRHFCQQTVQSSPFIGMGMLPSKSWGSSRCVPGMTFKINFVYLGVTFSADKENIPVC